MARVGGLLYAKDSAARSLSTAQSLLIRALVAKPAALYELATGASALGGTESCTPKNPQRLLGVDLSGPPWGPAILHPIMAFPGLKAAASVQAPASSLATILPIATGGIGVLRAHIWQRPHDNLPAPHVAPYSRGLVALRAHAAAAGSTTVTVRATRPARAGVVSASDQPTGDTAEVLNQTTFTVASVTETTFVLGAAFWIPLVPGDNTITLAFTHTTAGAEITIDSLLVYNGVKLTH